MVNGRQIDLDEDELEETRDEFEKLEASSWKHFLNSKPGSVLAIEWLRFIYRLRSRDPATIRKANVLKQIRRKFEAGAPIGLLSLQHEVTVRQMTAVLNDLGLLDGENNLYDRAKVIELALEGMSEEEIAKVVNANQSLIRRQLTRLRLIGGAL